MNSTIQTYYTYLGISDEINITKTINKIKINLIHLFNDYVSSYNLQSLWQSSSEPVISLRLSAGDRWLLQRNKKYKDNTTNNSELDN